MCFWPNRPDPNHPNPNHPDNEGRTDRQMTVAPPRRRLLRGIFSGRPMTTERPRLATLFDIFR